MRADSGSDALEKGGSRRGRTRTGDDTDTFGGAGGGGRKRDEKSGAASTPTGDSDKRDGEDAIMRFKREMRERDGLVAPLQEPATSATTPAATVADPTKPVSASMFDHLTRPPPMTANSAPLLPPPNAAGSTIAPGSGLFRDPAILSSPAASPSIASASIAGGAPGGQKRAPGGSRFAKFFTEEQKKAAPAPPPGQQMASPPMGGQASPQVGNLMSILSGGGGPPPPPPQQHPQQQRTGDENNQMNKLLAMLQSSHVSPTYRPSRRSLAVDR